LNLSIMLGAKRSCRSGMRRRIWSAFLRMYCAARRRGWFCHMISITIEGKDIGGA
jgi:hypothetical protein